MHTFPFKNLHGSAGQWNERWTGARFCLIKNLSGPALYVDYLMKFKILSKQKTLFTFLSENHMQSCFIKHFLCYEFVYVMATLRTSKLTFRETLQKMWSFQAMTEISSGSILLLVVVVVVVLLFFFFSKLFYALF